MAGRERRKSARKEAEVEMDPAGAVLSDLHLAYAHGQLRILVGAGMSLNSGLPGWDTLNLRLLEEHLRERYGGMELLTDEQFAQTAQRLYARLGRDGSADLVRMLSVDGFEKPLARALYGARTAAKELVVRSSHLSLAALARRTRSDFLFTTNFDPLLELGLATPPEGGPMRDWRQHRLDGRHVRRVPQVAHLHGWIDPGGASSPVVVLTESDYLELAARGGHQINRQWQSLINGEGALLVLGMSLNDPNLRRFLHARRRRAPRAQGMICAVFEQTDHHTDTYLRFYWQQGWRIQKLNLESFESIPILLRTIAFGPGSDASRELSWLDRSRAWVASRLTTDQVFNQGWQEKTSGALARLVDRLRIAFQVPNEERMTVSLFLPVNERRDPALISRVATSRGPLPSGSSGRAEVLRTRSLSVASAAPQGVAGRAFLSGLPVDAPFGSRYIDAGFPPEMVKGWDHQAYYRDWRSIYAIPMMDGPDWLPVAVLTVNSSFSDPFWTRFTDERRERYLTELKRHCRKTAKSLIEGGAL